MSSWQQVIYKFTDAFCLTSNLFSNLHREQATAAIQDGIEQLAVLRRQAIIGNLYPSTTSVMENQPAL